MHNSAFTAAGLCPNLLEELTYSVSQVPITGLKDGLGRRGREE